jgi:hypothetical protein
MRLIDQTPYLEEDGSINIINRIQGTLKNGFSWYGNLQAQSKAVAFFEKQFDKKFTLIRNLTLGASQITIPMVLIGPPGVYVLIVTDLSGTYRAKGPNWGKIEGDKYKEASINLPKRALQFTKAIGLYLEKQGIELPQPITPLILSLNPALHIETVRPAVRIVMTDALKRFAVELRQSPPIMVVGDVHQVSEALTNPLRKKAAPTPISQPMANEENEFVAAYDPYGENSPQEENNAFGDLGFSFDDEETPVDTDTAPPEPVMKAAPRPRPAAKKRRKQTGLFGMTNKQLIVIAALAGFVALMLIVVIIIAIMSL